jgi:hypothetical protein
VLRWAEPPWTVPRWAVLRWAALAGILAGGAALRILGAQSELWLDEVWTLQLLAPLTSPLQVVFDLTHDNNHPLNSLWIYAVGLHASPLVLRALSVAAGVASIVVAGALFRDLPSRLVAMSWMALSPAMVNHASEARGYSVLILCVLTGTWMVRRELENPSSLNRQVLGLACGVGLFAHAFMIEAILVFAAWALLVFLPKRSLVAALAKTFRVMLPAIAWTGLVVACAAMSIARSGLTLGQPTPFSAEWFLANWGTEWRLFFGIPESVPVASAPVVLVIGVAVMLKIRRPSLLVAGVLGGLGLPALLFIGETPNVFARYFLVANLFVLLLAAEVAGFWISRRGPAMAVAASLAAAVCLGQVAESAEFLRQGRGHYSEAVRLMGEEGSIRYGGREGRTRRLLSFYADRAGIAHEFVPEQERCLPPPRWMVLDKPELPDSFPACGGGVVYRQVARFPSWVHSGHSWTVFRTAD